MEKDKDGKTFLDKDETDLLIDKKVAEAKSDISESRLKFALWFGLALVTIFGIALPMCQSERSADEVDRAVQRMDTAIEKMKARSEDRLKEMEARIEKRLRKMEARIDEKLRKPEIDCYFGDKKLEDAVIFVEGGMTKKVRIINTGDKDTDDIKMRLYTKEKVFCPTDRYWEEEEISDEHDFNFVYKAKPLTDVGDYYEIEEGGDSETLQLPRTCDPIPSLETEALLKVYYGLPEPKRVAFAIKSSAGK